MLKVQSNTMFNNMGSAKCGEIYCQSSSSYTIICAFCELKIFEYEDFLLHFKNLHFENELLKTDEDILTAPSQESTIKIKCGVNIEEKSKSGSQPDKLEGSALNEDEDADTKLDKNWQDCAFDNYDSNESMINDEDIVDDDEDYKPPKVNNTRSKNFKEHKCKLCENIFKNMGLFKLHMKREHGEGDSSESVSCSDCRKDFLNLRHLDAHSLKEHNGVPCLQCDKRYRARHHLNRHMEIHKSCGEKNFICDFDNCIKRFLTSRQLRMHKRMHTMPKNFICDVCGYSCRVKETLRVHYRIHTGEKPYVCALCKKRFSSSSLLSEHKASHATDRPHKCYVCEATFSRPKALYHHKFLHLGVKKFICKICGNAYAQAAGLAGHMRKHKEEGHC